MARRSPSPQGLSECFSCQERQGKDKGSNPSPRHPIMRGIVQTALKKQKQTTKKHRIFKYFINSCIYNIGTTAVAGFDSLCWCHSGVALRLEASAALGYPSGAWHKCRAVLCQWGDLVPWSHCAMVPWCCSTLWDIGFTGCARPIKYLPDFPHWTWARG